MDSSASSALQKAMAEDSESDSPDGSESEPAPKGSPSKRTIDALAKALAEDSNGSPPSSPMASLKAEGDAHVREFMKVVSASPRNGTPGSTRALARDALEAAQATYTRALTSDPSCAHPDVVTACHANRALVRLRLSSLSGTWSAREFLDGKQLAACLAPTCPAPPAQI